MTRCETCKRGRTDYGEFDRHEYAEEVEKDLERWPFRCAKETPCTRRENEGVPGGDSECAYEEVLVRGEVRGKVEVGR